MQKFKTLYTFTFPKVTEVNKEVESVNEAGETVVTKKKTQESVEQEFCLQRAPRSVHDEAELFFNVTVSKGIQAGLMSAALLSKRFSNDGGILSEAEKQEWGDKFVERVKKELDLQKLTVNTSRNEEEQAQYDALIKDIAILNREMQEFEVRQQSLFDVTAEARARTRTIMWWLLFILHRKNSAGEWVPFFDGKTLEEKQWSYDELDDEDIYTSEEERKFNARVVTHAVQAITLWYYGHVAKQDDFEKAFKSVESSAQDDKLIGKEE